MKLIFFTIYAGTLTAKNNRFELNALNKAQIKQMQKDFDLKNLPPTSYNYGQLDVNSLIQKLIKEGITDAKLEQLNNNCTVIHLKNGAALIKIDDNKTHICCDSQDTNLRSLLRDLVSQCLKSF